MSHPAYPSVGGGADSSLRGGASMAGAAAALLLALSGQLVSLVPAAGRRVGGECQGAFASREAPSVGSRERMGQKADPGAAGLRFQPRKAGIHVGQGHRLPWH